MADLEVRWSSVNGGRAKGTGGFEMFSVPALDFKVGSKL